MPHVYVSVHEVGRLHHMECQALKFLVYKLLILLQKDEVRNELRAISFK